MEKIEMTEKKVFSYIEQHKMIAPHDHVVVGVSGGADSVCLLFLLLKYAKQIPFSMSVVHVNHGIRKDAGEDAEYVRKMCQQHKIPFRLIEEDVRALARREKCSEEDAGRRVRYEAFRKAAEEVMGTAKIAVAHNSNDNAETMLFHLFRGTGLTGLCGIVPVRDNIIRPILCLRRKEIEEYLLEQEIAWRKDSTNDTDDYTRNRIRHNIMYYTEQYIVPNASGRMHKTAEMLQETEDYLEQQTQEALKSCLVTEEASAPGNSVFGAINFTKETKQNRLPELEASWKSQENTRVVLKRDVFQTLHPVLQKRILFKLAKQVSPTGKDISRIHVEDMLALSTQEGNRRVNLPFGIIVRQQYNYVVIERGEVPKIPTFMKPKPTRLPIQIPLSEDLHHTPLTYDLGEMGKVEITLFFSEKEQEVPRNRYTKWFDYDKIIEYAVLRTRMVGDYLTISDGAGGSRHKSLKDYMITEKIPKELRDRIPVLAVGNHVIWLIGFRISEDFKVSGNTKRILQVKLLRGYMGSETEENHGRAD